MITYRRTALPLAAGATCLVLAACSAGITSASATKPAPTTPATHRTTAPPTRPAASPSPTLGDNSASVAGLGSFPLPSGAHVEANIACGKGSIVEAGPVTPSVASAFYASALPRAGYTVTNDTLASDPNTGASKGLATVMFSGRRYSGVIIAMANVSSAGSGTASMPAMSGSLTHDVLEISLAPGSNPDSIPSC